MSMLKTIAAYFQRVARALRERINGASPDTPLLFTTRGNVREDSLNRVEVWTDQPREKWAPGQTEPAWTVHAQEHYFADGELGKRSVYVYQRKGLAMSAAQEQL